MLIDPDIRFLDTLKLNFIRLFTAWFVWSIITIASSLSNENTRWEEFFSTLIDFNLQLPFSLVGCVVLCLLLVTYQTVVNPWLMRISQPIHAPGIRSFLSHHKRLVFYSILLAALTQALIRILDHFQYHLFSLSSNDLQPAPFVILLGASIVLVFKPILQSFVQGLHLILRIFSLGFLLSDPVLKFYFKYRPDKRIAETYPWFIFQPVVLVIDTLEVPGEKPTQPK